MDIQKWIDEKIKIFEDNLFTDFKSKPDKQERIYDAMLYSLKAGGKRLRPLLMMGTYEMLSAKESFEEVLPFAEAMEMIHTYSLIHDDLPAMDDDDYRRGKLSNHKKFDEATAILAGDALLNKAFEIMSSSCMNASSYDQMKRRLKVMNAIAKSSGTEGMVGGQIIDIYGHELVENIADLKKLQSMKTGAIIESAAVSGAILAGSSDKDIEIVIKFSDYLGTAFQIQDDILDVTAEESELGKPVGSDEKGDKITFVSETSLVKAQRIQMELSKSAVDALSIFGDKAESLINLTIFLTNRRK